MKAANCCTLRVALDLHCIMSLLFSVICCQKCRVFLNISDFLCMIFITFKFFQELRVMHVALFPIFSSSTIGYGAERIVFSPLLPVSFGAELGLVQQSKHDPVLTVCFKVKKWLVYVKFKLHKVIQCFVFKQWNISLNFLIPFLKHNYTILLCIEIRVQIHFQIDQSSQSIPNQECNCALHTGQCL